MSTVKTVVLIFTVTLIIILLRLLIIVKEEKASSSRVHRREPADMKKRLSGVCLNFKLWTVPLDRTARTTLFRCLFVALAFAFALSVVVLVIVVVAEAKWLNISYLADLL